MGRKKKEFVIDWNSIQGAFVAGVESLYSIADRYGITEAAIRYKAKKQGWIRSPEGTKRQIVKSRMSGISDEIAQDVKRSIENAANEDVNDLNTALLIQRKCLQSLYALSDSVDSPKEIKTIVEATDLAIESIKKIRGLNDPVTSQVPTSLDFFYGNSPSQP